MHWHGDCSCLRQWKKQPFILDQIFRKYTRIRISSKFRICSISNGSWNWNIPKRFWMWTRLTVPLPHGRDRHYLTIKWCSGQKKMYVSTQTLYCVWANVISQRSNYKMGRSNGRNPLLMENYRKSMEKQLSSSGISSQDLRLCRFFKESIVICKSGTLNLRNSQIGSSSCQCSTVLIGQEKEAMIFVFQLQKKSRRTRRNSRRDTGRSSVLETKQNK